MKKDDQPWLTSDEQESWRALTSVMTRLPHALDAQLRHDAGLSHFEYTVLSSLSEAPGRTARMRDLASLADGSLSRLSQVVTKLERRGWVSRSPDPGDGRTTLATLTDDGWAKVVAAAPGHAAEVRRLVADQLTAAQMRQLGTIGRRILSGLDQAE